MKAKKDTWIRTAVLFLALLNQALTICGLNPLPFSEEMLYEGLTAITTASVSLWNWWKNNSFTDEAIRADYYLKQMKEEKRNG